MRVDCGQLALRDRKFADSSLEGTGFEPSVPQEAFGVLVAPVCIRAEFCVARKFVDSLLEGVGFELLVPRHESLGFPKHPGIAGGSSTGEGDVSGAAAGVYNAC